MKCRFTGSSDGKMLAYTELSDETGWDIWVLELDGDRRQESFLHTEFQEGSAVFSPNGHWLAYGSNESAQGEVCVRSFPKAGGKWQVSTDGGNFGQIDPPRKKHRPISTGFLSRECHRSHHWHNKLWPARI